MKQLRESQYPWVDEWRAAVDRMVYFTRISSLWTDEKALCEVDYFDITDNDQFALVEIIRGRCVRRKLVLDAFRFGGE